MSSKMKFQRWTKHGHDRLYLTTTQGLDLGWVDLRSGRQGLKYPGMGTEIMVAVEQWKRANPGWSQAKQQRPAHMQNARPSGLIEWDLADNRPGEALAAKAERLQVQHPLLRVSARFLGVRTRDRSWKVGAKGERKVGRKLDKLTRAGWRVLHNVEFTGGGDVDHLVIGKFGVFTINTKHHRGAVVKVGRKVVFVRGRQRPYVGKAHREASRTHQALSTAAGYPVNVTPLVVVHGHSQLSGWLRYRPQGVQVLPSWLVRWWFLLPGHTVLNSTEVEDIYDMARRSSTWSNV